MAKPRRPRGLRPISQSRPPLDQELDAAGATPLTETTSVDEAAPPAEAAAVEPAFEPEPELAAEAADHEPAADPAPYVAAAESPEPLVASEPVVASAIEPAAEIEAPIPAEAPALFETPAPAPAPAETASSVDVPVPEALAATLPVDAAPALALVPVPAAPSAPAGHVIGFRFDFNPESLDVTGISGVIVRYMRGESDAVAAHMRALSQARSPADMIRLQVGEFQRAADASLTCWSIVAHKASRVFAYR